MELLKRKVKIPCIDRSGKLTVIEREETVPIMSASEAGDFFTGKRTKRTGKKGR